MARFSKLYDDTRGRLARVLTSVRREPTGARPTTNVRIKLGALPAALRAVVRDESHGGILIEAELPWLTVGSDIQAEFPDGREKAGRVHWFGVDATRAGSARLRIFVDLSSADGPSSVRLPDVGDLVRPRPSRWSWALATVLLVVVASVVVHVLTRRHAQPEMLPSPVATDAPPRAPAAVAVPKDRAEAPAVQAPAPANPTPARAKPKRKRR